MQLLKYLQAQGLGSRKQCMALLKDEYVLINGSLLTQPNITIDPDQVSLIIDVPRPNINYPKYIVSA